MLTLILSLNLFTLFFLMLFQKNYFLIRSISIVGTGLIFLFSLITLWLFDIEFEDYQFRKNLSCTFYNHSFQFFCPVGLDHLSILFLVLTSFLVFLCVLYVLSDSSDNIVYSYMFYLLQLELFLFIVFSALDTMFFYLAFEAVLLPMFGLTGHFGSRERKTWALYLLIFYTICGSLLMLLGIVFLFLSTNSYSYEFYKTVSYIPEISQKYLWCYFALSFLCKIPMFPLHIWLPEAHVEAPTVGSVILAGILLKLGVYGLIRYNFTLFPLGGLFFSPYILTFCSLGVIFASLCAVSQSDLKRIIAYSSVAHMNLIVIGIFGHGSLGLSAAVFQSISHGFIASGLFFLIGFLYSRYHSRALQYYSGLVQVIPLYSIYFLFFSLSNLSLPGTSAFIGELLIILQSFLYNQFLTYVIISSIVICAVYSLWLTNRLIFGNLGNFLNASSDLNKYEFIILFSLSFFTLFFGFFPDSLLIYTNKVGYSIPFFLSLF